MQSGITASAELHEAFKSFQTNKHDLALIITIDAESLVPKETITSGSQQFPSSLTLVHEQTRPNEAAYIILRTNGVNVQTSSSDTLIAITYVPDSAPVRSKMLFASTRLTLVRELGADNFAETIFFTNHDDISAAGWTAHEKSRQAAAPLSSSEMENLRLREEEGEQQAGTASRRAQFGMALGDHSGSVGSRDANMAFRPDDELVHMLQQFSQSGARALLSAKIDVAREMLTAEKLESSIDLSDVSQHISSSDPRYTLYKYDDTQTLFIYTCPSSSKIKERMLYASARATMLKVAESQGSISITKKLEGSDPSEFTAQVLADEFKEKVQETNAFARPKRPGKR